MRIPKDTIAKQEDDLKTIINSLFSACVLKYQDKSLTVEEKHLIFRIVDNCKVTPTKAKEYLNILESRGEIVKDRDVIVYTLKEQKEENDRIMEKNKI